jgi:hypothetical protein
VGHPLPTRESHARALHSTARGTAVRSPQHHPGCTRPSLRLTISREQHGARPRDSGAEGARILRGSWARFNCPESTAGGRLSHSNRRGMFPGLKRARDEGAPSEAPAPFDIYALLSGFSLPVEEPAAPVRAAETAPASAPESASVALFDPTPLQRVAVRAPLSLRWLHRLLSSRSSALEAGHELRPCDDEILRLTRQFQFSERAAHGKDEGEWADALLDAWDGLSRGRVGTVTVEGPHGLVVAFSGAHSVLRGSMGQNAHCPVALVWTQAVTALETALAGVGCAFTREDDGSRGEASLKESVELRVNGFRGALFMPAKGVSDLDSARRMGRCVAVAGQAGVGALATALVSDAYGRCRILGRFGAFPRLSADGEFVGGALAPSGSRLVTEDEGEVAMVVTIDRLLPGKFSALAAAIAHRLGGHPTGLTVRAAGERNVFTRQSALLMMRAGVPVGLDADRALRHLSTGAAFVDVAKLRDERETLELSVVAPVAVSSVADADDEGWLEQVLADAPTESLGPLIDVCAWETSCFGPWFADISESLEFR